jgi:hypothetical protein
MLTLNYAEKAYNNIQHPFLIKTLRKLGTEETFLNMVNKSIKKTYADIVLIDERPKGLPLRFRTGQGCSFLPVLFNTLLGVLVSSIRQEKNK